MAIQTATGTTTARTTTGTTSITGLGFKPNLILFWGTLRTSDGIGVTSGFAHMHWGVSYRTNADATGQWCYGAWAQDNVATSNTGGSNHDDGRNIAILGAAAPVALDGSAQIDSYDDDGFTLNWDNAAGDTYIVNWFALGGDDLEQIEGQLSNLNTSSGLMDIDLTWRPDLVMFFTGSSFAQSIYSFGIASSADAADQFCVYGINRDNVNPTQTAQTFSPGNLGGYYRIGTAIEKDMLFHLSEVRDDGFTINKTDPPNESRGFVWLALKGGFHDVGVETVPAATGIQSVTVDVETPISTYFWSGLHATDDSDDVGFSFGAMTRRASNTAAFYADDNVSPSVVDQYQSGKAIVAGINVGTPAATSVADEAGFSRFPGAFHLDWTAVSGNEEQYGYWAVGPGGFVPQIYRRVIE